MEPQTDIPRARAQCKIKPRKRLVDDKPGILIMPLIINQAWSIEFMHDQLLEGRSIRLLM
jgi:putative transposase